MATKQKVIVAGKPVDMDKVEEMVQLQHQVVPENWTGSKKDGVRVFLANRKLYLENCAKHFDHQYKKIARVALEQKAEQGAPTVVVAFSAELNFSANTVAAIGDPKMSFSRKFVTKGNASSIDINQEELDLGGEDNIAPGALEADHAAAAAELAKQEEAAAKEKEKAKKKPQKKKAGEKPAASE